jgi:predicted branched-subunit amino acid permease
MFYSPIAQIGVIVMALICILGLLRGELALRLTSGLFVFDWVGSEALEDWNGQHKAQPTILSIDIAFTAVMVVVVMRTRTQWPKYALVANALIVTTHLGALVGPQVTRWDFFTLYYALSYVVLATLLYGALAEAPTRRTRS